MTKRRRDALWTVASEWMAGHDPEMARAAGLATTIPDAERFMDDLAMGMRALSEMGKQKP